MQKLSCTVHTAVLRLDNKQPPTGTRAESGGGVSSSCRNCQSSGSGGFVESMQPTKCPVLVSIPGLPHRGVVAMACVSWVRLPARLCSRPRDSHGLQQQRCELCLSAVLDSTAVSIFGVRVGTVSSVPPRRTVPRATTLLSIGEAAQNSTPDGTQAAREVQSRTNANIGVELAAFTEGPIQGLSEFSRCWSCKQKNAHLSCVDCRLWGCWTCSGRILHVHTCLAHFSQQALRVRNTQVVNVCPSFKRLEALVNPLSRDRDRGSSASRDICTIGIPGLCLRHVQAKKD